MQPQTVCVWRYTTFYIYYALLLIALFLSSLTDQPPLFSREVKDSVRLPDESLSLSLSLIYTQITVLP